MGIDTFLYAQKQATYLPQAQITAEQPVERLQLLANQPQQYKVSFMAGEQVTLSIHTRSTPAFSKLFTKVTPFAVAGIAQSNQTQGLVARPELNGSRLSTNPFKVGFTVGVGALTSLASRRSTRILATISLYSSVGKLRKTETRWLKSKNESLRIISKKRDGYAIVTLQSPINCQINIVSSTQDISSIQINSKGVGSDNELGNQPITNGGDCANPEDPDGDEQTPDFGIESGSGSYSDPYVLSEVSVIAEGTGSTTDYGGGFYYYTGGYYNGSYYDPGYYQDGTYQGNTGGPSEFPNPYFNISSLPVCSQNIVRQLVNSTVVGDPIIGPIKDYAQNQNIKLTFEWSDIGDPHTMADTRLNNATENSWIITLNSAVLANASREYIAATILHEVLHIILPGDNAQDHNDMAANYIPVLEQSLTHGGFLMSETDREALSWEGLGDTAQWQQMVANDQANNTGTTGNIAEINRKYREGENGQTCN